MNIQRDIGSGVFTWTDVVTGIAVTRTEYSRGSAAHSTQTGTEAAWINGTITLAQSSANTGTTNTVSIFASGNGAGSIGLYCTLNGVLCSLALK